MSCCPLNTYYLAVAVLSAVQCPLLKTVGFPSLDGLASGICAPLGGSGAVTNACNCLTAANAPGACGSGCTDSRGIGPGYALYTPLSSILGSVAKLAGESACPGTTGYYCLTGQTCKTRTGSAPYCCNNNCYNSLEKCADTSWQQYRVTIGASTSNFCCGNGTIGVYQSTGQNSVGICATARPAFYTAIQKYFYLSLNTSISYFQFDNLIAYLNDIIGVFQYLDIEIDFHDANNSIADLFFVNDLIQYFIDHDFDVYFRLR
ncbi:hypothetical protein BPAE_0028g00650 [Botrytis paeoniae]|uniref:Uncharacterized protein n=1 Tax=Botrytis paeoniae TaxID=278948 RepID=A0A4Z1FUN0_9HELO|nr:hypothetical protein BPAE_0028g00650 [Botrytis paeoniae]